MALGWLLIIIGLLFGFFGIGGKAKFDMGKLGTLSGGSGIILIVVGVVFVSAGI